MGTISALLLTLHLANPVAAQTPTPIADAVGRIAITSAPARSANPQPSYRPVRHSKSTRALAIGLGAFCGFLGGGLTGAKIDEYFTGSGKRGFLIGASAGAIVGGVAVAQLTR